MPKFITCKLTGNVGPGVKAHVIPRSFFPIDNSNQPMRMIRAGPSPSIYRRPIGEYDDQILTMEGEEYFRDVDDYAAKLLLKDQVKVTKFAQSELFTEFGPIDYHLTKLFFLSVLWRAAASQREYYAPVQLGEHEERLRQHILRRDPGGVEDFAVVIGRPLKTPAEGNPMFGPRMKFYHKPNGEIFTVCEVFLGRFNAMYKINSDPFCPLWTDHSLAPGGRLRIARFSAAGDDPAHPEFIGSLRKLFEQGRLRDFE